MKKPNIYSGSTYVHVLLTLMILSWSFLVSANASEMPPGVTKGLDTFDVEVEKAKVKLLAVLEAEMKTSMKKGDIDLSNSIKALIDKYKAAIILVNDSSPSPNGKDTDLLGNAVTNGVPQYPSEVWRLPGQLESHEEAEVIAAINTGKLTEVVGGKKFEKIPANTDKAFDGGGGHKQSSYYVFNVNASQIGIAYFTVKAAPFNLIKLWVNGNVLMDKPHNKETGSYSVKVMLNKGQNLVILKYINTWDSRWVKISMVSDIAGFVKP